MRIQLLCISVLIFCTAGFAQGKEAEAAVLPVFIRYSDNISHPPDSVTEFIKSCLLIKRIQLIDSVEAKKLIQSETERALRLNYKKGDPFPDFVQIMKWTQPVARALNLSIYWNTGIPEFSIDSIRWGSYDVPIKFENKGKHGVFKNAVKVNSLFSCLKSALDEIVTSVFSQ